MIMALTISILVAGGVYLIQQRGMVRLVLGMQLFGHAANLMLLATGVGAWRGEVFPDRADMDLAADPLPQAFVLTAIVISMATATILLTMAAVGPSEDTVTPDLTDPDALDTPPSPNSTLGRAQQSRQEYQTVNQARAAAATRAVDNKEARR